MRRRALYLTLAANLALLVCLWLGGGRPWANATPASELGGTFRY